MQTDRRALYNSLRMHWLIDPSLKVEEWQVQDYRAVPLESLFEKLQACELHMDRATFIAYAENFGTPEELADHLATDLIADDFVHDLIYLLIFELWRRLVPEKRCLSIFCDELDHQITSYDLGKLDNPEPLENALATLEQILDQNEDAGVDPHEVFASICAGCANDIENFLYDFILEQIDNDNLSYAAELHEAFSGYVQDKKRFEFLGIRVLAATDSEEANILLTKLIRRLASDSDLDIHFDILAFLVQEGEKTLFPAAARSVLALIETEEDFRDLLTLCADYYHCLDREEEEHIIEKMLQNHLKDSSTEFSIKDGDLAKLKTLLHKSV